MLKAVLNYNPFHKTLPISSLQIHWTSVMFYEMGRTPKFLSFKNNFIHLRSNTFITNFYTFLALKIQLKCLQSLFSLKKINFMNLS